MRWNSTSKLVLLLTLASEPPLLTHFGDWQKIPAVYQEVNGSTASQLTFLPGVGRVQDLLHRSRHSIWVFQCHRVGFPTDSWVGCIDRPLTLQCLC